MTIAPLPWSAEARAALADIQDRMRSEVGASMQRFADALALKIFGEDETAVLRALVQIQTVLEDQLLASGSSTSNACGMSNAFADLVRTRLMNISVSGWA